jgi:TfoX/Sxy family transcriptional regulator of competence genes
LAIPLIGRFYYINNHVIFTYEEILKPGCLSLKSNDMAYNEKLADRTRELIALASDKVEEKKMFGGLCFMVNGKMCLGVEKERLMVRIDPARYDEVMELEGCHPMDFTGKVMKGFVFVDIDALNTKKKLEYWVNLSLEYNRIAKASKKKNKLKK